MASTLDRVIDTASICRLMPIACSVTDHCLRSRNYINVVVAGKQSALATFHDVGMLGAGWFRSNLSLILVSE